MVKPSAQTPALSPCPPRPRRRAGRGFGPRAIAPLLALPALTAALLHPMARAALAAGAAAGAEPSTVVTPPAALPLPERPLAPPQSPPAARAVLPAPATRPDQEAPLRFDHSLDDLVRQGIVTPAERQRIRTGATTTPPQSPAHQRACRSGALSEQECASGLVVRWRGRGDSGAASPGEPSTLAFGRGSGLGEPLTTPLTVPVSALLAGAGGSLSLADVFAVTPRPAPVAGNGNRRLLFPLIGPATITSGFGFRLHPVLGSWMMHAGKDLAAPEGTPVVAALAGRVVASGVAGGYGLTIELEHDNPRRRTLYAHLSELYVKPGERVRQGEVIGRVGSTGLSTGPHLHFELRLPQDGGWVAVDPGGLDPAGTALGSDAIAQLMGQLLQRLERPRSTAATAAPLSSAAG